MRNVSSTSRNPFSTPPKQIRNELINTQSMTIAELENKSEIWQK